MNKAYLLTGSNIENRMEYLGRAVKSIAAGTGNVLQMSGIYETAAWGKTDQASFLNQALLVHTLLNADELMEQLLAIETQIGRKRLERYGPRTIDIDILLFNDEVLNTALVRIPHPELPNRRFALQPLAEIAGEAIHPLLHLTIQQLLDTCTDPLPTTKWNQHLPPQTTLT